MTSATTRPPCKDADRVYPADQAAVLDKQRAGAGYLQLTAYVAEH